MAVAPHRDQLCPETIAAQILEGLVTLSLNGSLAVMTKAPKLCAKLAHVRETAWDES